MLFALGGLVAAALAWLLVPFLTHLAPSDSPLPPVTADRRILLLTSVVALLTGLVFRVLPGRALSKVDPARALATATGLGGAPP